MLWKETDELVEEFAKKDIKDAQNRQNAIRSILSTLLLHKYPINELRIFHNTV